MRRPCIEFDVLFATYYVDLAEEQAKYKHGPSCRPLYGDRVESENASQLTTTLLHFRIFGLYENTNKCLKLKTVVTKHYIQKVGANGLAVVVSTFFV